MVLDENEIMAAAMKHTAEERRRRSSVCISVNFFQFPGRTLSDWLSSGATVACKGVSYMPHLGVGGPSLRVRFMSVRGIDPDFAGSGLYLSESIIERLKFVNAYLNCYATEDKRHSLGSLIIPMLRKQFNEQRFEMPMIFQHMYFDWSSAY